MRVYLVQHGKNVSKDEDSDPGLSPEGIQDVERIAQVAAGYHVQVSKIIHSVKKRARQTAEIMADVLKPSQGIMEKTGLKPMDDVTAIVPELTDSDRLMIVGHLPFLSRLTSLLITGSVDVPVFKFQNGGIVCLEKDLDVGSWLIQWTLMPAID